MNFVEVESLEATLAAARQLRRRDPQGEDRDAATTWHAVIADPAGNACLVCQADPLAFPPPLPD